MSRQQETHDTRPSVLVVVPTLGTRPDTLHRALDSVVQQQGVRTTLVVVVPADETQARETARARGAVVVDDPRTGLSGAVNAGIAASSNEQYFAWIGDDDLMLPGGLATLSTLLARSPGAVVAYGACEYIDEAGGVVAMSRAGRFASWILPWGPNLVPQPASLTRLAALRLAGEYDEDLKFAMDLDMFLRLRKAGDFVSCRTPVAAFRWHPDSLTVSNRSLSLAESEFVKRRHLPRGVRPLSRLWDVPIGLATRLAVRRVNARARRLAAATPQQAAPLS